MDANKPEAAATYEKPEVIDYGDLKELTERQVIGLKTDKTFPAGTPFGDLTFSLP
jgi:hypothetical protein